jgi:CheY-like chemotaxis protein
MGYIKKEDQLKILILEDMANRIDIFKKKLKGHDLYFFDEADDAIEALRLMNEKPWDMIFLDHDLGQEMFVPSSHHNTGYTVAKFIAENDVKFNQIIIHSMNPAGAQNMKSVLKKADVIPFAILRNRL